MSKDEAAWIFDVEEAKTRTTSIQLTSWEEFEREIRKFEDPTRKLWDETGTVISATHDRSEGLPLLGRRTTWAAIMYIANDIERPGHSARSGAKHCGGGSKNCWPGSISTPLQMTSGTR